MTIKIIGAVCIIIACTAIGFSGSYRLYGRYGELAELKKILCLLSGEIRFGSSTLEEAFGTMAERVEVPYSGFFNWLSEKMGERTSVSLAALWQEAVEKRLPGARLDRGDKELLGRIGKDLGCLDRETQLNTIALAAEQVEERKQALSGELPKKMKLYNCLGILSGVFLTILLI